MARKRVAIVGGGFSGAVLASELMKLGRGAPDVVLIERRAKVGRGLAYGTKEACHLLNVRASSMSASAERPDHFVSWLSSRGRGFGPGSFAPRVLYGAYVESVAHAARKKWFGPRCTYARDDVIACRRDGEGWALELAQGQSVAADAVVLATGNPPVAQPRVMIEAGVEPIDPWDHKALRTLPKGDVLVLGTGLTAVDAALVLTRRRKEGVIYALSRRGQLPRAHLDSATPAPPGGPDLPATLSEAVHVLRREARAALQRGEPWQYVVDRLRARTPEFWQRLGPAGQARFLRHLRPWWDAHRHRMAPEIAQSVKALQEQGRLRLLAGEVVACERVGRVIHVQHRGRGSHARHHFEVVGVVNCTGAAMDLANSQEPLLRQLFKQGLVRAPENGVGLDVDMEGHVRGADGHVQETLFALGPLTQGIFWECTAVPEIRVRAAALAKHLAAER